MIYTHTKDKKIQRQKDTHTKTYIHRNIHTQKHIHKEIYTETYTDRKIHR